VENEILLKKTAGQKLSSVHVYTVCHALPKNVGAVVLKLVNYW